MPRLSQIQREQAIGMLRAGASQRQIARRFGVSQAAISQLLARYQETGSTNDRPRPGQPKLRRIISLGTVFNHASKLQLKLLDDTDPESAGELSVADFQNKGFAPTGICWCLAGSASKGYSTLLGPTTGGYPIITGEVSCSVTNHDFNFTNMMVALGFTDAMRRGSLHLVLLRQIASEEAL